ncbi:outer dense fiber protein 2 [Aphidius gifuensis]|uniref:outer dense fiber protein 2 n=1 Tax=Aphidius gifuensis TaxID=684658 RepID=UPI001CDBAA64|nr:outer dense fiber protein 2 [Aphidius gifuensis]
MNETVEEKKNQETPENDNNNNVDNASNNDDVKPAEEIDNDDKPTNNINQQIISSSSLSKLDEASNYHNDSIKSSIPMHDTAVMSEMKEAHVRSKMIQADMKILNEELNTLRDKSNMTNDDKELIEKKGTEVMERMKELEELTIKFAYFLGLSDTKIDDIERNPYSQHHLDQVKEEYNFDDKSVLESPLEPEPVYPEDSLPRVIICGNIEDGIPRIVVADSYRRISHHDNKNKNKNVNNIIAGLTDTLTRQEQAISDKYTYEKLKKSLEDENEKLQSKICGLEERIKILAKEKAQVDCQLQQKKVGCPFVNLNSSRRKLTSEPCKCTRLQKNKFDFERQKGGGSRDLLWSNNKKSTNMNHQASSYGSCPAEIKNQLHNNETSTKQLENQMGNIESKMQHMKMELANVQRERQQLEQQRKLLNCTAPCAPCPCGTNSNTSLKNDDVLTLQGFDSKDNYSQQELYDLREKYSRLQEDYRNKLCEVSCLRRDAEKLKNETRQAINDKDIVVNQLTDAQNKLKNYEMDKKKYGNKREQGIEQEQALIVAKHRYREAQDELEELKSHMQDQSNQLEDYRNKYLEAQEQVEEQKRVLDLMELDNARMNENVNLEISRIKSQFQDKLSELALLPDLLRQTQIQLQESQRQRALAEHNCEDLSKELSSYKDKYEKINNEFKILQDEYGLLNGDKYTRNNNNDGIEKQSNQLSQDNERLKNELINLENEYENKLEEKIHEIVQLSSILEEVREDSARQVARTKERCEIVRRDLQGQISVLEKELAKLRATAKAAEKERDEIRIKMQSQLNRLTETFGQAQGRVKTLQGQIDYLSTSYNNVFDNNSHQHQHHRQVSPIDAQQNLLALEASNQSPYDSCDCAY